MAQGDTGAPSVRIVVDAFGTVLLALLPAAVPGWQRQDRPQVHRRHHDFAGVQGTRRDPRQIGGDPGMKTLAEGVETMKDHLRVEHVDEAEGFLLPGLSIPMC